MPIYVAVDSSLSMRLTSGEEEGAQCRYVVARNTALHIAMNAALYCPNDQVNLVDFSYNSSILLSNASNEEDVNKAFANIENAATADLLSLFSLMRMEKVDDSSTLIVLTDASSFTPEEMEMQHLPKCRMRFGVVTDEWECNEDQVAKFTVLSMYADGIESYKEVSDLALWRPLFLSEFDDVVGFSRALFELHAPSHTFTLTCGLLTTSIHIIPYRCDLNWKSPIDIIGFVKLNALANPPCSDHHFIAELKRGEGEGTETSGLVSLLSHCLLTEESVAVCRLGENVYGTLCALRVKDFDYRLTIQSFPVGLNSIAWMPDFDVFTNKSVLESGGDGCEVSLTDDHLTKPSYSSTQRTFWGDLHGIQSDMQKLVRQLRKIPDRLPMFYAEVSRMHLYACAIGAEEIHKKLIDIIRDESASLEPIVKKHCSYVCEKLRKFGLKDPSPIVPME